MLWLVEGIAIMTMGTVATALLVLFWKALR